MPYGEKVALTSKKPAIISIGSKEDITTVTAQFKENEKFFIFDLDDTLYHSQEVTKQGLKVRMDFGSKIKGWSKKHWRETRTKYSSFVEGDFQGMGVSIEEYNKINDAIETDFKSILKPEPKVIEALSKIPCKKIIFSNRRKNGIEKILEALGLSNMFDLCFGRSGNEDFIVKPKKEAYDYVQEKLKVTNPQNIFFFDDLQINTQMAKVIGWNALHADHNICEKIDEALEIFSSKV